MDDSVLERLLWEVQAEPLSTSSDIARLVSCTPDDQLAGSLRRNLEGLAWIDEQMLDTERLAERFGLSGLLPGIALTQAGIVTEVELLVSLRRETVPSIREPAECRVLLFPSHARR